MSERREPKVGDRYKPVFQSDLDASDDGEDVTYESLTIHDVHYLCDDDETWSITASDGVGYDCVWSDRYQVWCYNLD